eukprot:1297667-Pleurochrysis_carterae.AAC.1
MMSRRTAICATSALNSARIRSRTRPSNAACALCACSNCCRSRSISIASSSRSSDPGFTTAEI